MCDVFVLVLASALLLGVVVELGARAPTLRCCSARERCLEQMDPQLAALVPS
jgi:hypothetical protein